MNEFESVTAGQMERLVDGELNSSERRSVLMALDSESDGWRRLALAFLESQAMRESLQPRPQSVMEPRPAPAPPVVVRPARFRNRREWRVLALGICGAVIFGLGRLSRPSAAPEAGPAPLPQTYVDAPASDLPDEELIADSGSPAKPHQTLRLELAGRNGGPAQSVEVPMVEDVRVDPEQLMQGPPVIPDSVQRELLKLGRRVYEQRQLVEVTLEDGRRGVVPVSDVLVENAGSKVFQ